MVFGLVNIFANPEFFSGHVAPNPQSTALVRRIASCALQAQEAGIREVPAGVVASLNCEDLGSIQRRIAALEECFSSSKAEAALKPYRDLMLGVLKAKHDYLEVMQQEVAA